MLDLKRTAILAASGLIGTAVASAIGAMIFGGGGDEYDFWNDFRTAASESCVRSLGADDASAEVQSAGMDYCDCMIEEVKSYYSMDELEEMYKESRILTEFTRFGVERGPACLEKWSAEEYPPALVEALETECEMSLDDADACDCVVRATQSRVPVADYVRESQEPGYIEDSTWEEILAECGM